MENQKHSFTYASLAILLWATVATAFKLTLSLVTYFEMLVYSCCFSLLSIFLFLLFSNNIKSLKISKSNIIKCLVLGLINPLFYYLFLFYAYSNLPASKALVLNYTWPLTLTVIAVIFLKENMSLKKITALVLGFCGIIVVANLDNFSFDDTKLHATLAAIFSSFFWATFWIFSKKIKVSTEVQLFYNFLSATIILLFVNSIWGQFKFNLEVILGTAYIGFFEMGFTFILWSRAMQLTKNVSLIGTLAYAAPVLSLLLINFVLSENLSFNTLIGFGLILLAILINRK